MESAVVVRDESKLVKIEDYAMSIDGLVGQVALIQRVMEKVMKENEHYGKIPGTDKPTLLKPGAEKLCLTFRLNPGYDIIEKVREKDFIAYTVRCDLTHIISQTPVASGIGSCNSRETKYRYRMVPTDQKPSKEEAAVLKAKGLGRWKKFGESWTWMERIENDNPWDLDNTLIKMACKRALVAATLNATAASDIFTQDVEDLPPEILGTDTGHESNGETKQTTKQKITKKELTFIESCTVAKQAVGGDFYFQLLGSMGYEKETELKDEEKLHFLNVLREQAKILKKAKDEESKLREMAA